MPRCTIVVIIADFCRVVTEKPLPYTIPMTEERFDVLDCAGRKTGALVGRDEAHCAGIWHGAFHCLMIYPRAGKGTALFQKRSGHKKIAPGLFDVSVGGHYAAGEDAAVAGPREVREELGLAVQYSSLVPLGRRIFVYCHQVGIFEYEFQDVFLLPVAEPPGELALEAGEVDAVLELDIEEGIALFSGKVASVHCLHVDDRRNRTTVPITPADFVPNSDNYYLKLLLLAQRYMRGDRDLLVI